MLNLVKCLVLVLATDWAKIQVQGTHQGYNARHFIEGLVPTLKTRDEGKSVILRCPTPTNKRHHIHIQWYKDNVPLLHWNRSDKHLVRRRWSITLKHLTVRDTGEYWCVTGDVNFTTSYYKLLVSVVSSKPQEMKAPAIVAQNPKNITVVEGETAILKCRVSGPLKDIVWFRLYKGQKKPLLTKHQIYVDSVENNSPNSEESSEEKSSSSEKEMSEYLDDDIHHSHSADKHPGPNDQFRHLDEKKYESSWTTSDEHDISESRLLLSHIQEKDEGQYVCLAKGFYGDAEGYVWLHVVTVSQVNSDKQSDKDSGTDYREEYLRGIVIAVVISCALVIGGIVGFFIIGIRKVMKRQDVVLRIYDLRS